MIDTSNDFSPGKTRMMSIANYVLIITQQDHGSAEKLKGLLNDIDCSDTDKFVFACNKYRMSQPDFLKNNADLEKFTINAYIPFADFGKDGMLIKKLRNNTFFDELASKFI